MVTRNVDVDGVIREIAFLFIFFLWGDETCALLIIYNIHYSKNNKEMR